MQILKPFQGEHRITQIFGVNRSYYFPRHGHEGHNGVDYSMVVGTKLRAAIDGIVKVVYNDITCGNYIKIYGDECACAYIHLSKINVKDGERVVQGQWIVESGNTGNSTGPHLHFGVHPIPRPTGNGYGGYVNPLPLISEELKMSKLSKPVTVSTGGRLHPAIDYMDMVEVAQAKVRVNFSDGTPFERIISPEAIEVVKDAGKLEEQVRTLTESLGTLSKVESILNQTASELSLTRDRVKVEQSANEGLRADVEGLTARLIAMETENKKLMDALHKPDPELLERIDLLEKQVERSDKAVVDTEKACGKRVQQLEAVIGQKDKKLEGIEKKNIFDYILGLFKK